MYFYNSNTETIPDYSPPADANAMVADAHAKPCTKCSATGETVVFYFESAKRTAYAVCPACAPLKQLPRRVIDQYLMGKLFDYLRENDGAPEELKVAHKRYVDLMLLRMGKTPRAS